MTRIKEVLARLAGEALAFLQKIQDQTRSSIVSVKGAGDIATQGDIRAESFILGALERHFPGVPVLTEETGLRGEMGDLLFMVDPLDGSTNYHRGHGHYAVAIALVEKGMPLAAAAAVGETGEIFSAMKGEGAYLGEKRLRIQSAPLNALSMTALPSHFDGRMPAYVEWLYLNGGKIRNYGSSVSHICQIADGRIDLCVLGKTKLWDFVAPGLILKEAGGFLGDFHGKEVFPLTLHLENLERKHSIVVSNGEAHKALMEKGILMNS